MLHMKRTLRLCSAVLIALLLLPSGGLRADIIVLKTGEKIEGTILSETDTTLTYKYQLTPKISDTKTINKADIKELTRFTPAQVEMQEKGLNKLLPTPDLLKASDYESIIQDSLRTFVAKHPGTPEAKEVEKMIATLSEEKAKVLSGMVKMEGKWLDEPTAKREAYNIEAYRLRMAMKAKLAEPGDTNLLMALREFDTLRTNHPASLQYLQAIPEALDILEKYEKRLSAMASEQPVILKRREDGLKSLTGTDLALSRNAIENEEREFKARLDAQNKAKMKWRDIYRYDLKSIQAAQTAVAKERQDLKNINLAALQTENENLNAAIRYISEGNATEADVVMERLRPNKSQLINKVEFAKREKELSALLLKQKAEMKAAKSKVTVGTDPTATDAGKEGSNPIADAMAKKAEAKKEAAAAKEAKAKEQAAAKAAQAANAAPEPEEEKTLLEKINAYIPYIGGGLLVILIIAMMMGKKKKDDDE